MATISKKSTVLKIADKTLCFLYLIFHSSFPPLKNVTNSLILLIDLLKLFYTFFFSYPLPSTFVNVSSGPDGFNLLVDIYIPTKSVLKLALMHNCETKALADMKKKRWHLELLKILVWIFRQNSAISSCTNLQCSSKFFIKFCSHFFTHWNRNSCYVFQKAT